MRRIAEMAAAAEVHRRDQLHPRRKGYVGVGSCDPDVAGLQRLPERIQHLALELRQFVEKQDAEMGEADFDRPNAEASAHERRHRGAVMR